MPWGRVRGQNLGDLRFFLHVCFHFSSMESFLNEQKVIFRVGFLSANSVTSVHRVQGFRTSSIFFCFYFSCMK